MTKIKLSYPDQDFREAIAGSKDIFSEFVASKSNP